MAHTFQAIEVSKRQIKGREDAGNIDNNLKLEAAESKLQDLKSNMTVLGKEAIVAMTAVEAQQQRLTLQRLIAMVWFIPHFSKCHFFLLTFLMSLIMLWHKKKLINGILLIEG